MEDAASPAVCYTKFLFLSGADIMRYFLDPFGCVKNQVDAENMMALLNNAGWEEAPEAAGADIIIVNSCGFIESAKRESINAVIAWKKNFPEKKILLAGNAGVFHKTA